MEYPTDAELRKLRKWDFKDVEGFFEYAAKLWSYPDRAVFDSKKFGWYFSTGGWSGNESVIAAMQANKNMIWTLTWLSSRRGGHYWFLIPFNFRRDVIEGRVPERRTVSTEEFIEELGGFDGFATNDNLAGGAHLDRKD